MVRAPGEVLKASRKSETRQVGEWVVKRSCARGMAALCRHTFCRERYRLGWVAAHHLQRQGVAVADPWAYVEWGRFGLIWGNAFVSAFLDGTQDVEHYADAMVTRGWKPGDVHAYLGGLAEAVNRLCASGAYHTDLAGKNILTRDGREFYFIDLEGVVIGRPYTRELRMETHVQLYDSFCDRFDDTYLEPFIAQMLPEPGVLSDWMNEVRATQRVRRARTEAIWREQGRAAPVRARYAPEHEPPGK